MTSKILVVGAGSWGTALALVLARNGHETLLWGRSPEHIQDLNTARCNRQFLPEVSFPEQLKPVSDFSGCFNDLDAIVMSVPCVALRQTLELLKPYCSGDIKICLSSKGLEQGTQLPGHEVVAACLGDDTETAVLSGPSFAREVAMELPTAVTIASTNPETAEFFANCFRNDRFRTYTHDDVIGVEIGAAIKNVMAIATGIADGLGFGANTRSALITRGLAEIMRLGVAVGARQETFMGLAGLGDLILTCTDDQSRNRRMGLALAAGKSCAEAEIEIGQAVEGVKTVKAVCELAAQQGIEMPISEQVAAVIEGLTIPKQAVQNLLAREPGAELPD